MSKNDILDLDAQTEYYRIERIGPRKMGPSHAKVLVYTYHKKTKSPEEYRQIEIDPVNEQG